MIRHPWMIVVSVSVLATLGGLAFMLPRPWSPFLIGCIIGLSASTHYIWGLRSALVLRFHGGPRDGDVLRLPAPDIVTVPLPDGGVDESGRYVFDGFDGYWQRADVV